MPGSPHRASLWGPSQVSLKTVFTVCFGVLLVVAVVAFLLKTPVSVTLVIAASMVAIALDHLVVALERRRVKRGLAITIVMLGCLAAFICLALVLIPPVVTQIERLVEEWPNIWARFRQSDAFQWLELHFHIQKAIQEATQSLGKVLSSAASPVLVAVSTILQTVITGVSITFLTLLMLIFGRNLVGAAMGEVRPERRARYTRVVQNIYRSVGGYLGGLLVICSVNAICATTFLGLTREPYFAVLGVLSGVSAMIPYVGPAIAAVSISCVAWASGGIVKALATAVYFIIYGQIEGNLIAPLVFRRTSNVNPLVTLVAIMFLAELAGIFGALIAVPVAATLQIVVRELFAVRRERAEPPPRIIEPTAPSLPPPPH
jgi:predicted PurR-regulated permease PerM